MIACSPDETTKKKQKFYDGNRKSVRRKGYSGPKNVCVCVCVSFTERMTCSITCRSTTESTRIIERISPSLRIILRKEDCKSPTGLSFPSPLCSLLPCTTDWQKRKKREKENPEKHFQKGFSFCCSFLLMKKKIVSERGCCMEQRMREREREREGSRDEKLFFRTSQKGKEENSNVIASVKAGSSCWLLLLRMHH